MIRQMGTLGQALGLALKDLGFEEEKIAALLVGSIMQETYLLQCLIRTRTPLFEVRGTESVRHSSSYFRQSQKKLVGLDAS